MNVEVDDFGCTQGACYSGGEEFRVDVEDLSRWTDAKRGEENNIICLVHLSNAFNLHFSRKARPAIVNTIQHSKRLCQKIRKVFVS